MKSILYFGALLMIGASIYGFVDYRKTSRTKEFNQMYAEPDEPVGKLAPAEENATIDPGPATTATTVTTTGKEMASKTSATDKKTVTKKRKFKKKDTEKFVFNASQFSRARPRKLIKEEPVLELVVPDKLESTNQ